jgi:hypothetical protein
MSCCALRFIVPLLLIGVLLSGLVSAGLMKTDVNPGYPMAFQFTLSPNGFGLGPTKLLMRVPITVQENGKINISHRFEGNDPELDWDPNEDTVTLTELTVTGNYDHVTGKLNATYVSHVIMKTKTSTISTWDEWARGTLNGYVGEHQKTLHVRASIPIIVYSWVEGKTKKPENPTSTNDESRGWDVNLDGLKYAGTTSSTVKNTPVSGEQKAYSCIPLLTGFIALLGAAIGSKLM